MLTDQVGITRGLVSAVLVASVSASAAASLSASAVMIDGQVDKPSIARKYLPDTHDLAVLESQRTKGKQQAAVASFRLASFYASQGKWKQVEPLILEILQLQPKHIGYLLAASQYAFDRKNNTLARELLLRAIDQVQLQHPDDSQRLLKLKDNLALIYAAEGLYQNAEMELQQNLQVRNEILTAKHPDIADNLYRLGYINVRQKELDKAEEQLHQALSMLQPEGQEHGVLIAQILHNLGGIYRIRGQFDEARIFQRRALAYWEKQPKKGLEMGVMLTMKSLLACL